ncbi:hypothetical protein GCM10027184_67640 [Saccharothrix stipae]
MTRDTVFVLTWASAATSLMVGSRRAPRGSMVLCSILGNACVTAGCRTSDHEASVNDDLKKAPFLPVHLSREDVRDFCLRYRVTKPDVIRFLLDGWLRQR